MNRNLSVKEVVALFEKFMGSLVDDELEKIVGKPTKSKRQEKVRELAGYLSGHGCMAYRHPEECLPLAEAALEWVEKQLPKRMPFDAVYENGYNQALEDVRKNLGVE